MVVVVVVAPNPLRYGRRSAVPGPFNRKEATERGSAQRSRGVRGVGIAGQEKICRVLWGDSEQAGQMFGVVGWMKFWYWLSRGQELDRS